MMSERNEDTAVGPNKPIEQIKDVKLRSSLPQTDQDEIEIFKDTIVFSINEENLKRCPRVKLNIGNREVISLLDSGADNAVMSVELFEYLTNDGLSFLQIPIVNCILTTVFGHKSKRIKSQALIEFKIDNVKYELAVILAPQMKTDFILGMNFMIDYGVRIDFSGGTFETRVGDISHFHQFYGVNKQILCEGTESGSPNYQVSKERRQVVRKEDRDAERELWCQRVTRNVEMTDMKERSSGEMDPGINYEDYDEQLQYREMGVLPVTFAPEAMMKRQIEGQIYRAELDACDCDVGKRRPQRLTCGCLTIDERSATLQQLRDKADGAKNIGFGQRKELFKLLTEYRNHFTSKPEGSAGIIAKFTQMYTEPMKVTKLMPPAAYEVAEPNGKIRGVFHKEALKPYLLAD
jgi:predicted aspartyl protease